MSRLVAVSVALLLVVGCGPTQVASTTEPTDQPGPRTTITVIDTSSTSSTAPATSTTTSATTTTVAPSSTSTGLEAPVGLEAVVLLHDGLDIVSFGQSVDEVMAVLTAMLGPPDWEEIQGGADTDLSVSWDDPFLYLQFTDFDVYRVDPESPDTPPGPVFHYYLTKSDFFATQEGIRVGTAVESLKQAHPDMSFERPCDGESWQFIIEPPQAWPQAPMFGLLDGDPDLAGTRITYIGAGLDRTPC